MAYAGSRPQGTPKDITRNRPFGPDRGTEGLVVYGPHERAEAGSACEPEPLGCPDQRRRGQGRTVARKKTSPVGAGDRKVIGGLLRDIRRAAGYRSVGSAAATKGCPASRQTIYAYERGGLVPSLPQFLELVEFFVLEAPASDAPGAKAGTDLRAHGISAVTRALTLPAYHVTQATDLIARMQPDLGGKE